MSVASLTWLEAINTVMRDLKLNPLRSEGEIDRNPEARRIIGELEVERRAILLQGWGFNTMEQYSLPLTAELEAILPANVLRVGGREGANDPRYKLVGRKLYNRQAGTTAFTMPPKIDLVIDLEWDDLPFHAAYFIAKSVSLRELSRKDGAPRSALQVLGGEVARAEADLTNFDERQRRN